MNKNSWPTEFSIGNVRCFKGMQQARLRPITFLVGENSTGKTSFLGCYSVIHRMLHSESFQVGSPDFNREPFNMGSFKDIVRNERETPEQNESFVFELRYEHKGVSRRIVRASFDNNGGQPYLTSLEFVSDGATVTIVQFDSEKFSVLADGEEVLKMHVPLEICLSILFFSHLPFTTSRDKSENLDKKLNSFFDSWFRTRNLKDRVERVPLSFRALAPLRASPSRTYDPVKETVSPAGSHIPLLLMRLARAEREAWINLRAQLVDFGEQSGMFVDLGIDSPDRDMGAAFNVQVKVRSNSPANLMDVGYGVSQSLPILVDVLRSNSTLFVLQQPEVHLHPRSQADLATFFVKSVENSDNRFLIETHSDYLVDRVRINVRQGLISADDVSILFFEPTENAVTVHNLWLDEHGNLEGTPSGYRDFFLRESDRLIGFAD